MLGFLGVPMGAAYHLVAALAQSLTPLGAGLATAAAIVIFTAGVRLLLSPLSFFALRGQARLSALQPKIAQLRAKYGRQPERLQTELSLLYRAEGGGMLAGCLPSLLQLPFFSVMYRLFRSKTVDGKANGLLARKVFGTPLGSHWLAGAGPLSAHGLVFAGLLVLLAGAAFMAARAARQPVMAASGGPAAPAAGPPAALGRILPYSTVVIAAFVPLAAGLYLLTTTAWTLAERAVLRRITSARDGASGPAALPAGSARSAR